MACRLFTWTNDDQDHLCGMVLPGHNEFTLQYADPKQQDSWAQTGDSSGPMPHTGSMELAFFGLFS